ncbi:Integrin [Schistosoma japonicum]|uniref:Integrin n=1 Tax=Schistosoma japonicum TaxID=6182 RepID=A0A4Z2D7T8_SCHJA|nr:Integrin [Schistosoma japonicum]
MWINSKFCQSTYDNYYYYYYFISIVLYTILFVPIDTLQQLNDKSYSYLNWEYDYNRSHLWSPRTPINVWPDFKLIQECDTNDFKTFHPNSNNSFNNVNKHYFEWTSISIFTSERFKRGYILLGGSYQRQQLDSLKLSDIVSPRQNNQIFLCNLDWKSDHETLLGFGFNSNPCVQLEPETVNVNDHEFLGASSQALKIGQDLSIFVYCDPLWRAGSKVPVGRCFSHIVRDGQIQPSLELADFCQTGMQVATPCAAGQSIALSLSDDNNNNNNEKVSKSISDALANTRLWVGQPLSTPYGRIQILTDLYGSIKVTTINRPETTENIAVGSLFGYALTDGFVTAPGLLTREKHDNNTNLHHLVGIHFAKSSRDTINEYYGSIDWFPEINTTEHFSGNGMSILRVHLKGPYIKSVVMGAPYASNIEIQQTNKSNHIQSTGINIGRIYLYCQLNSRMNSKSDFYQFNNTIIDYLDGPSDSTNFGFALTNLGDFDSDGNDDIAVGAPNLDKTSNYSHIYLIRLLPNCKFDRTPLHILTSPKGAYDFGAHLPTYADDLDFNGNNDLVVPISSINQSIIVYATRYTWIADCHFIFPPWLTIRNLLQNDLIPIQIMIYFKDPKNKHLRSDQIDLKLLNSLQIDKYHHQINTDWNATDVNVQRFRLVNSIKSRLELKQNQLMIEFNIQAKMNVEDMHDLELSNGGVYLSYRFLQPCYGDADVIDQNGTCLNGGWLKRPLIDWSKCLAKLPLSRYVCYPSPICESDVVIRVKDIQSGKIIAFQYIHDRQKSMSILNQTDTIEYPLSTTIDIEYGNKNSSRPQLQIEIYNYGPTKAKGTRMELQFHGNLRFSRLELEVDTSNSDNTSEHQQTEALMVEVAENETWVHCPIGTLLPPIILSDTGNEIIEPNQRFILSTYYDKFMLDDDEQVNFQIGAGVTIHVITGTLDPQPISNSVRFNYQVVHKPNIRISYGPGEIASKMDNRSAPAKGMVSQQKRVIVSEIGPKVEHILQIEYMGPSNKLKNVTMNVLVPIELNPTDQVGETSQYLLYMFNEIRAPSYDDHNVLEWIDSRPKVYAMGRHSNNNFRDDNDDSNRVGRCIIVNSEKVVNPRELIPMDVKSVYSRRRRGALTKMNESEINTEKYSTDSENQSTSTDSNLFSETIQSSSPKVPVLQFRRLQKEVFECNRVGNRIQKPPICAEIICHVDELVKNRPVLIKVTGWLWARTLFAKHISDIDLVTIVSVNQGHLPKGVKPAIEPIGHFYLSQTFFFPQIRPKLIHQIPIWPIIVGIVLGVICLYLLIILLYLLGFFRRRKTELRKAMLSKGGAEDIYKREQTDSLIINEQIKSSNDKQSYQQNEYTNSTLTSNKLNDTNRKSHRKKYKRNVNILHPGDLDNLTNNHHHHHQNKNELEEQKLITDSTSSQ